MRERGYAAVYGEQVVGITLAREGQKTEISGVKRMQLVKNNGDLVRRSSRKSAVPVALPIGPWESWV
jgi:hypothetical protein